MYRDSENYKVYNECILSGELSIKDLSPYLFTGEFFIPSEVGLKDLQELPLHTYDHIWHEIVNIATTNDIADIPISAEYLISAFKKVSQNDWNQFSVMKRLNIL
jgi:hypothetical protein